MSITLLAKAMPRAMRLSLLVLPLVTTLLDSTSQSASAEITLPGRCYQGRCFETLYFGKTQVERGSDGTLYSIEWAARWADGRIDGPKTGYIYCSTTRPASIRPESPGSSSYLVSFLNPGGTPSGASMTAYPVYWATCHNLIGPRFNISESQAREMGYPLNLRESQIMINDLNEFLNQ